MSEQGAGQTTESDASPQVGESVTGYWSRRLAHDAWVEGHDAACPVRLHPCGLHPSPYSDSAYPPAQTGSAQ